jgi:hypothetical protein
VFEGHSGRRDGAGPARDGAVSAGAAD